MMPAGRTKHRGGRAPLQADALEALWFEEGDGVAILEYGRPLAVIGWSDMDQGMPGYSSDVIGQTPFGWSLDDALEGLAPRLERSMAYWRWRQSDGGGSSSRACSATWSSASGRAGTTGTRRRAASRSSG